MPASVHELLLGWEAVGLGEAVQRHQPGPFRLGGHGGWTMLAETRLLRGVGLWLAVVFFVSGCAAAPAPSGRGAAFSYAPGLSPAQGLRATATASLPEDSAGIEDEAPLYRRPTAQTQGAEWGETKPLRASHATAAVCGDVPSGWPFLGSEDEVLAPFLGCTSPAAFVALQRTVDMPRLVESLSDWNAVRLGALGPLDAKSADTLNRKRAAFLVGVTEKYGVPRAEVFALFVLHSSFDDELRQLLRLLTDNKQSRETLGQMAAVREELQRRGLEFSAYPDRAERAADVLRGLARAGRDALSSSSVSDGARYQDFSVKRGHLPPPYQAALDEVERALMEQHYSPGSTALGAFDHLTFGVPLGFYHLVAGAGHGAYSAHQGRYEQATRELAPAALAVALYAGGRGTRALVKSSGARRSGLPRLAVLDAETLKAIVKDLEEKLGGDAAREVFALIRGERSVGYFVAAEGLEGAIAIHEAQGNVPKAQAMLAEAYRERPGATSARGGVREGAGAAAPPRGGTSADVPIRNAHLAGKRHPVTGVPFDADGYPDFGAAGAVRAEVKIPYTGSRAGDFAAANKAAGLRETPKGMTWHHHQDRTTMQLVPTDIHAKTGHTGGFSGGQE